MARLVGTSSLLAACSGHGQHATSTDSDDGRRENGAAGYSITGTLPDSAGAGGAGGSRFAGAAGSPAGAGPGDDVETAGASSSAGDCSEVDEPDDDLLDTNCDGIDGDKSDAIFAAPGGDDDHEGTMNRPVRTLAKAVELGQAAEKPVYACNGTYEEALEVGETAVRVFGGYDCQNGWARLGHGRALVVSPTSRALVVRDVVGKVVFDRVSFAASHATKASESSIGVTVIGATDVTLSHTTISAGEGADGHPGETVPDLPQEPDPAKHGMEGESAPAVACDRDTQPCDARPSGGGPSPESAPAKCPSNGGAITLGGPGGRGGNPYLADGAPSPGREGVPRGAKPGAEGRRGADALPAAGAPQGFGTLDRSGYVPSNRGEDGVPGAIGQAGGGGDGAPGLFESAAGLPTAFTVGGGGGGGGGSGCGGWGGGGGGAGGASVALLVVDSMVTVRWATLVSGRGGNGAMGSQGGEGEAGGLGGAGGRSSCTCQSGAAACVADTQSACPRSRATPGGPGGHGGRGADGGPGGGGPSIPLVVSGPAPDPFAVTFQRGAPGQGAGDGLAADGVSADQWPSLSADAREGPSEDG